MICRHCKSFIYPGVNSRVRVQQRREPHMVITCLVCGKITRIPLKSRNPKEEKTP
jgi:ribonuclease P protein subunit RPR2